MVSLDMGRREKGDYIPAFEADDFVDWEIERAGDIFYRD